MVPFVRELGESGWPLRPLDQWPALGSRSLLRGTCILKKRKKERSIDRSISDDRSYDPERGGHRGGPRVHRLRQRAGRRDRGVDPGLQSALGLRFRRAAGLPRLDSSVPRGLRHGSAFCQDSNETVATRHRLQDENEDNF